MITGFSHVQLVVSDLDASMRWYSTVLGMEELQRGTFSGGDFAALRSPTGRFVIGLQNRLDTALAPAPMIEHLSFGVESLDELHERCAAIVAAGIEATDLIEEAASWNVRFRDPDGLWIELSAPKPR